MGDDFEKDIIRYVKLTVRETRDMEPLTKPAVAGIQLIQVDGTHAEFSDAYSNFWSSMVCVKCIAKRRKRKIFPFPFSRCPFVKSDSLLKCRTRKQK